MAGSRSAGSWFGLEECVRRDLDSERIKDAVVMEEGVLE